ncbi:hypothetical protein [Natronospora cellulosivora (SeqCode)]
MLEGLKEKIQIKLKNGEITEEKANELNESIDKRLEEIKEFKKLTLEQKKSKLISELESRMEEEVEDGKISQEKANIIVEKFIKELEDWDGESYPKFMKKYFMRKNH